MAYQSTRSESFRRTACDWITRCGEVLALIRFSRAAGAKDFEFFTSPEAFEARLADLPVQTCVTLFRDRQLPIRGSVDEQFIDRALALIDVDSEWLLVALERTRYGEYSWFAHFAGETREELRADLQDNKGIPMACGQYPPWLVQSESVISAVVPDHDGVVRCGVY
jgi:hypothetical protein